MANRLLIDRRHSIFKIVGIYAVFGFLWIYTSDTVLGLFALNSKSATQIAIFKGSAFIIVTSLLLYILIKLYDQKTINSEQAAIASEIRFEQLFQKVADPIYITDTKGKIIAANDQSCRELGHTREEMLQLHLSEIDASSDANDMFAANLPLLTNNSSITFETNHRRKDGSVFPVELNVCLIDLAGQQAVMGVARNITERKRAAEQLQAMNQELERKVEQRTQELLETQKQYLHAEKLSAIGKLSACIAHEFNNPLQGVITILKGVRKRAILEEEDKQLMDAAISESNRMKDLIRSLQDFNRPSSGRQVLIDLHKSLDSLLLLHKRDLQEKQISVILDYAKELPLVMAVPDQIKQVLLNLLTNAADACQQSGGVITITTWQEGGRVAVAIKDTGIGINPEDLERIFQPFYTTKNEVKGTGLGLSVSHGIIKKHQGEIRVDSQPGEGATFTVLLPIDGGKELSSQQGE